MDRLLDLLCGDDEPWTWGHSDNCSLIFNRDNTGAITCGEGLRIILAVEFDWKVVDPPAKIHDALATSWEFEVELTLSSRLHPLYKERRRRKGEPEVQPEDQVVPNWFAPLASDALQPKRFALRLEKGRFISILDKFHKKPYPLFQTYSYLPGRYTWQITFDKSPYPPMEQWRTEATGEPSTIQACLEFYHFWEFREFVRGEIPKSQETWAERLSPSWWLSPAAGRAHRK